MEKPIDAVILFAGGLYPKTNLPNHLSISRLFQIQPFLKDHKDQFGYNPHIIFCGGQVNYHTGVQYPEPSSNIYRKFFSDPQLISDDLLLSTGRGICTVTEALGAKMIITERGFNSVCLNTSKEHEARTMLISRKVFDDNISIITNPYNQPDGGFMNSNRESMLSDTFTRYFDKFNDGNIPYADDKSFYETHLDYYQSQRSLIESTARPGAFDSMAYLNNKERE